MRVDGFERTTGAGAATPVAGGRRRDGPERDGHERRGAEPLEEPRPTQLRRAHTECDEEHRDHADAGPRHEEPAPPEPVGVPGDDRREHHLGQGLRGADESDRDAARPPAREVAQPELDSDPDTDGADSEQTARDEERADRARLGPAELRPAGRVERAGILPFGHPSRVAVRRPPGRNMPGSPRARTMVRSSRGERPADRRPAPTGSSGRCGSRPGPFPHEGQSQYGRIAPDLRGSIPSASRSAP